MSILYGCDIPVQAWSEAKTLDKLNLLKHFQWLTISGIYDTGTKQNTIRFPFKCSSHLACHRLPPMGLSHRNGHCQWQRARHQPNTHAGWSNQSLTLQINDGKRVISIIIRSRHRMLRNITYLNIDIHVGRVYITKATAHNKPIQQKRICY